MAVCYENECVSCPKEMGCLGQMCPHGKVKKLYCDECKDEADQSTICQCTGKHDIPENKMIYEHDFVSFLDTYSTENGYAEQYCVGEVLWDDEELCFYVTNRLSAESYEVLDDCKVIGNRFDNPELLE